MTASVRDLGVARRRRPSAPDAGGRDERRRPGAPFRPDAAAAYRELAPAVLGYLRARRAPDPEDLLGEVFLQVSRDLGGFRGDATDLRRWVFTIARNRMTDAFRRRARRPALVDRDPPVVAAPPPPDPVDEELVAALAGLGDEQREVVVLRFVVDLSLEDVAAVTGRSANAVKAMQHRALRNLRRALADA
ncbi:MAG: sigma-70 family RNA polymerase sigma factor [Microthrixaceae bacterium]|nr:sigma-70 family RNA polymerase sigma factor [Microthrixaceae bacterium]